MQKPELTDICGPMAASIGLCYGKITRYKSVGFLELYQNGYISIDPVWQERNYPDCGGIDYKPQSRDASLDFKSFTYAFPERLISINLEFRDVRYQSILRRTIIGLITLGISLRSSRSRSDVFVNITTNFDTYKIYGRSLKDFEVVNLKEFVALAKSIVELNKTAK